MDSSASITSNLTNDRLLTMIITTEDGYTFYVLEDGTVSDNLDLDNADMTWNDLQDFLDTARATHEQAYYNNTTPNNQNKGT